MTTKGSVDPPLLRQWKLLRLLGASRLGRTVRELAADASVSEKTVRRDLLTLAQAGFPLTEKTADHGKKLWRIESRAGVPEFRITFDEALGLYLAQRMLAPLAGSGFWESAESALQKIRVMLGDTALRYLEQMSDAVHVTRRGGNYAHKAALIDELLQGLEDRQVVWLTYRSQQATEPVTYDVHPYGLTCHRGALYLIGFAPQHNSIRTWKIDRIEKVERDVMPFTRPRDFNMEDHLAGSFGVYQEHAPVRVEIRFFREVARYVQETRWHESQSLTPQADGTLLATFDLTSTAEIKQWALSFGSQAEILAPEELRAAVKKEIETLAQRYSGAVHKPKPRSRHRPGAV
ncbi:MAG: WYL domain-containing protein [Pirellulales bacterium]|nr:WYL domain-containing protein [Pirellulales bacterium]